MFLLFRIQTVFYQFFYLRNFVLIIKFCIHFEFYREKQQIFVQYGLEQKVFRRILLFS